ncbi:DegT/DnrJ/EryC1/StrS family aminotransferase [Anoxybacillus kestanbolensis]|uniref:DegT/DnrJ/EryC1/StrS family aminotransferase n=1 Tax=Anoxybacillus kestanbolensis TaxID=227476 RepID=UPI003D25C06A
MDIINALAKENIEARPVWKPLHLQPVFNGVTYYPHEEDWSVSDELFANGICLPSGSSMTVEEQNRVIDVFVKAIKR